MNVLLIVVLALLVVGFVFGLIRGFTNILFETATLLVAIIIACILCSPVANTIIRNENMMNRLTDKVYKGLKMEEVVNKTPSTSEFFKNMNLPSAITDNVAKSLDEKTGVTVRAAAEATAGFVARMIIYVAVFIALVIAAFIVIRILDHFFDLVNKLPVFKEVNALAGGAVGIVFALFLIWVFFALVTLFGSTPFGASMLEQISSNGFLSFLYNNNLPMLIITNSIGKLI